ncbi:MAG TPA: xylose isomerase [Planctomycetaceae bacterium]|nr:xylose isomerase [Planctomycetaceae bacterium]
MTSIDRRTAVAATAATLAGTTFLGASSPLRAQEKIAHTTKPRRLLKTLKIGMIKVPGSLTDKFRAAKEAGFDGVEMNSPGMKVDETLKAIDESGIPVDGTVCSTHWNIRHTSADANTRKRAREDLSTAIKDTKAVGGHTVLLVVGKGEDGPKEEIWERSIDSIREVLPLCAEHGITIAIENVWNQFMYEHGGPDNQNASEYVKYVDELDSPWVGMQFDIGNHWKYGSPAQWIRELGRRVVKLDIKGYSREKQNWAAITEGDLPWAEVRQALDDIGFHGWVAAEVGGGDLLHLQRVANQIDNALNLG